jgi:hypothetical protein
MLQRFILMMCVCVCACVCVRVCVCVCGGGGGQIVCTCVLHCDACAHGGSACACDARRYHSHRLAGKAVVVHGGTNVTLRRLHVNETGAGGVTLSGGDREHLIPCGHSLVDSDISFTDS